MTQNESVMEIDEEERRRRLGRVYAILLEAAARRRARLEEGAASAQGPVLDKAGQ